jgi:hypothetical protein
MRLSPAGREKLREDPDVLVCAHAEGDAVEVTGFVCTPCWVRMTSLVSSRRSATRRALATRFNSVMVGTSIQPLLAIPLATLQGREGDPDSFLLEGAECGAAGLGGPDEEP